MNISFYSLNQLWDYWDLGGGYLYIKKFPQVTEWTPCIDLPKLSTNNINLEIMLILMANSGLKISIFHAWLVENLHHSLSFGKTLGQNITSRWKLKHKRWVLFTNTDESPINSCFLEHALEGNALRNNEKSYKNITMLLSLISPYCVIKLIKKWLMYNVRKYNNNFHPQICILQKQLF